MLLYLSIGLIVALFLRYIDEPEPMDWMSVVCLLIWGLLWPLFAFGLICAGIGVLIRIWFSPEVKR